MDCLILGLLIIKNYKTKRSLAQWLKQIFQQGKYGNKITLRITKQFSSIVNSMWKKNQKYHCIFLLRFPLINLITAHLEFLAVHVEQLCAIHTSGSKFSRVLIHVHGDQPQTHLLVVPLQDGSTLPLVVVISGNWVIFQGLTGHQRQ